MPARRSLRAALLLLLLLPAAPLPAQQRWTLTPELRIGSVDDPKTALSPVGGILVGEGGVMYVSQPQQKQIRIYSRNGELLRVIGGEGGGPGEFRDISRLFWRGDTLQVLDFGQQRFSLFTAGGEFIRTYRPLPRGAIVRHLISAEFPDGSILARARGAGADARAPLLRVTGPDAPDTLAWMGRTQPPRVRVEGGRGVVVAFLPIPVGDRMATSARVDAVHLVGQPEPASVDSAFFTVRRLSLEGGVQFERRFRYRPRLITAEDLQAAVARQGAWAAGEAERLASRLLEAYQRQPDLPRYHVAVERLLVGRDGTTWLQLSAPDPDRHQWMILDPAGELLARLTVPASLRILAGERGRAWGVETDELDVPYVVRYRIEARAPYSERNR